MTTKELNIVNCGSCGKVFAHELEHEGDINCPYCDFSDDLCHFPDFYYPPEWNDSIINITR